MSKDLKIAICFGLIIGALISFCGLCFADEGEIIEPSVSNGLVYSNTGLGGVDGKFNNGTYNIFYFPIEPGYKYILTGSGGEGATFSGYSNEVPAVDVNYYEGIRIYFKDEYIISSEDNPYNYAFFTYTDQQTSNPTKYFTITRIRLEGLSNFVDNVAYSLSIGNLSSVWVLVVPILAISVLVGLGVYFIRRIINKIKKKKGGI